MAKSKPPITSTTHEFPFDKLSSRDFERLCLWLVEREGYEHAEHLGAAGSEQGRDIIAYREGRLWAFQCKNVRDFYPKQALAEAEKVLALPEAERPAGLVFLVTCDVSVNTRQQVRERCGGEMECHFWVGTELDERVKRHKDIVEEFFRVKIVTRIVSSITESLPALLTTLLVIQILYYSCICCASQPVNEGIFKVGNIRVFGYLAACFLSPVCGAPALYGLVFGVQQMSHNRKVARRLIWLSLATSLISVLPCLPILALTVIPTLVKALDLSDELRNLLQMLTPTPP